MFLSHHNVTDPCRVAFKSNFHHQVYIKLRMKSCIYWTYTTYKQEILVPYADLPNVLIRARARVLPRHTTLLNCIL
jgi:hypothetical protein